MKRNIFILIMGISVLICAGSPVFALACEGQTGYMVEDLLSRMTLAEKIGQMTQADRVALDPGDIKNYFLGSVLSGGGSVPGVNTPDSWEGTEMPDTNTPESWIKMHEIFQEEALSTRLGIPIIYGVDAVHGHGNVVGATIFPHNIGLGATRNPQLIEKISAITANELKATGIRWNFSPCFAVGRDERWGRTYESYGELPVIPEMFASPFVYGHQGKRLTEESVLACAKHFVGDGGTLWGTGYQRTLPDWSTLDELGIDRGDTQLDLETLRAIHMPAYIKAIESGVQTVMISFSSVNGIKMHQHEYLITEVLKKELEFDGFVVSDWEGISELPGEYYDQVVASVNAGIDLFMAAYTWKDFIATLNTAVVNGDVPMDRIDDAVRRILRVKMHMKLFEHPVVADAEKYQKEFGSKEHRSIARKAVRESMVLLKNNHILPLDENVQKIFIGGRNADDIGGQCGGWTVTWQGARGDVTPGTTILEGIRHYAENEVTYHENCKGAQGHDVAIVVIGEDPYVEFLGDNDDLSLSEQDVECLNSVYDAGVPVVTLLLSGRPMIVTDHVANWDAFVAGWLPGTEGDGVAEVLFGKFNFKGTLPVTWPKSMSDIPINAGDELYDPLYEFGYGLHY